MATIDLLSDGRLDLGIGKGYREIEFKGFCVPKDEAQERYDECLEIMVKAWTTEDRFSWHGKRWSFDDIVVVPAVVQKPHPPLWTGAGTPSSIERVARSGHNLLLDQYGSFELTRERVRIFREACEAVDRRYDPMEVGLTRAVVVTDSPEATERARQLRAQRTGVMDRFGKLPGLPEDRTSYAEGGAGTGDPAIIGEPAEVIARLGELRDMGIEYVLMLASGDVEGLRRVAAEIMPETAEPGMAKALA